MNTKELQINKFKKIIKQDYPGLKIKSIKLLKSGWCNFVVEINKTYIFRFPQKTDFKMVTEKEIKRVEYLLNSRPRKRLGWKTPYEVFYELTGVALEY